MVTTTRFAVSKSAQCTRDPRSPPWPQSLSNCFIEILSTSLTNIFFPSFVNPTRRLTWFPCSLLARVWSRARFAVVNWLINCGYSCAIWYTRAYVIEEEIEYLNSVIINCNNNCWLINFLNSTIKLWIPKLVRILSPDKRAFRVILRQLVKVILYNLDIHKIVYYLFVI